MNLLANYSTSTISLKFIAPLGNEYIAAASLATSTYWMFGKLLVQSLCGALDTRASQVQSLSYFVSCILIFCSAFYLAKSGIGALQMVGAKLTSGA